ncbi:MAG: protoporphyrinogen oxidase [Planctomycetota bacterium]
MYEVLVIGGGVAGLAAAEHLARHGADVRCVEAGASPGGVTSTRELSGFLFEQGPFNVLCRAPEFGALLQELAGELRVSPVDPTRGARRFVLQGGRLHPVPTRLGALLRSPLIGVGGALRAGAGLALSARPPAGLERGATVDEVARRRFGPRIADNLVSALTVGVFGVESDELEARTALPFLGDLDDGGRSPLVGLVKRRRAARHATDQTPKPRGMLSFEGGLGALPRALARRLGLRFTGATPIAQLRRASDRWRATTADGDVLEARRVVLAVGARATAALVAPLPGGGDALAAELRAVEHASLTVVNLGFCADAFAAPLEGYGFLVARSDRDEPALGVLYASSVFPAQAPAGHVSLRVFFGGTRHPALAAAPEAQLTEAALDVLRRLAGLRAGPAGSPVAVDIARWPGAVPIYHPGHGARVARVRALEARQPGLALAGTYLDGVSVNDCVARGVRVARRILAEQQP